MSDDKEMSANTGIEIALAVLHQAIDGGSVNTHPERMLKAVVALTPFRGHLAAETAAIQKVRDRLASGRSGDSKFYEPIRHSCRSGQYPCARCDVVAALDAILDGRKK